MIKEKDLRRLVKKAFGSSDVSWIEPARGSTVGYPDCVVRIGSKEYPIELKVWHLRKKGIECKMRPAQRRYHMMAAKKKVKTAIMFAIPVVGAADEFEIFIIPNTICPKDVYGFKVDYMRHWIGHGVELPAGLKTKIVIKLTTEAFWKC